jgi:hypothetical protein
MLLVINGKLPKITILLSNKGTLLMEALDKNQGNAYNQFCWHSLFASANNLSDKLKKGATV